MKDKDLYKAITISEEGFCREDSIGMPLDQVIQMEGKNFRKNLSLYPSLEYKRTIDDAKKSTVYYYFKKQEEKVTGIDLFCYLNLYDSFEHAGDDKEAVLSEYLYTNNQILNELTREINAVHEEFFALFTDKYGKSKTSKYKSLGNKVTMNTWVCEEKELQIIMYYFLDKRKDYTEDMCQTLKISYSKLTST